MTAKPKSAKKAECAYERPTPEKIAAGKRVAHAREIAGLSQGEAAHALGYSQAVQLSLMESGQRPVPLGVMVKCAVLFGTTMDYLCGLAEHPDRDPAVALQRHLTARVSADVQRLTSTLARLSADMARELLPSDTEGARLAGLAAEAKAATAVVLARNPDFDCTIRGGASLIAKVELAAAAGVAYSGQLARTQRVMRVRAGAAANRDLFNIPVTAAVEPTTAPTLRTA